VATSKADLLLHPVRLRIVLETSADAVTASELARRLPDVPQATLYRHIATLVDEQVLDVVAERRVRGGVERTFRLLSQNAGLGPADAASLTPGEHLTGFVTFVGALVGAFDRYLRDPAAALDTDPVGYRQVALWLSDDETSHLLAGLSEVLQPYLQHEARPDRRRVRLSTVLIPDVAVEAEPDVPNASTSDR
jgi:hypothetical protein